MEDTTLVRLILLLPLLFITYLVVRLQHRHPRTWTWKLLAMGFITLALVNLAIMLGAPTMVSEPVRFVGYILLAGGFLALWKALNNLERKP